MAEMGVEPFLLVSTLKVVIGQRLVRKLCSPKEEYFLSDSEIENLGKTVNLDNVLKALKAEKIVEKDAEWKDIPFYKPKESPECAEGYSSRVGIHEVLKMSDAIKDIMMKGGTADDIEKQAVAEGMLTMLEDGIFKAVQGVTTIEEVLRVISE
jgi:type II secretory ATPase GspE/PulE/Tfp pilus assembly ATPase PilB-like protein